jgi:UDP-N-acetylmuramoyl-tripeptide--D-alanyl-D-alanine ligase
MKPLSINDIRLATNGRLLTAHPTAHEVQCVCTDSRNMQPSSLFIAIKGDNHDGHLHLPQAAAGGAIAALVQDVPADAPPNVTLIQVADTRIAMGKLATHVRLQMRAKVIAVAGSNGKTTTKYLIAAALSGKLNGSISPKSFNNDIGVPLAIFPADPNQDYLVLEMGTNHHGEILRLTEMAQPDIAVITNVGAEHLEFLDDLMGVRRENATIISGLNPKGLLVINGDDPELLEAVTAYPGKRVTFGFNTTNDLFAGDVECTDHGVTFKLNGGRQSVFVPMLGRHSASNALAAIAVARRMGVDEQLIYESLSEATGPEWRLQLQKVGNVAVLNDAYNANPNSMRAALETVRDLPVTGRRLAILGDMRELGQSSERYHREIGQFAATCKLDSLYCVGPQATLIADAAESAGMDKSCVVHFADAGACANIAPRWLNDGDLVLLKASRAIRLETVANAIKERFTSEAGTTTMRMAAS